MQAFREAGMDGAGLGVDSANPNGALGLYNKLGYTPARGFVLYAKELNET
jgi:ribosomal protein S18 acetylase RimI-like enzyme